MAALQTNFHASQLSGAVNQQIPSVSYAFATTNANDFGIDATYSVTGAASYYQTITPILVFPTSGAAPATCSHFSANAAGQSIQCNVADRQLGAGLYTLSFEQCPYLYDSVHSTYGCSTTYLDGAVTFSVVPPPTVTVTPTATVPATLTSGTMDITATASTVPSTVVTVTSYATTVISVQTSTTTLTGVTPVTVTGTCSSTSSSKSVGCNHDNCLRAFLAKTSAASAFCATYTAPPGRGVSSTPASFASSCMSSPSRLSSACTCIATNAVKPRKFIRGMAAAFEEYEASLEQRGAGYVYAPPDYTFSSGQYSARTFTAPAATTSVTIATIPTTTTTDPGAIVSSGTSTSTNTLSSSVTTSVTTTTIDSRSASTVTVAPTTCGAPK